MPSKVKFLVCLSYFGDNAKELPKILLNRLNNEFTIIYNVGLCVCLMLEVIVNIKLISCLVYV